MTNELKPCPFCGVVPPLCESTFVEDQGTKWGRVQCECGAQGPEVRTGYEVWTKWCASAVEEWNRRAPPPIAGVTPSVEECRRAAIHSCPRLLTNGLTSSEEAIVAAVRDLCLAQAAERKGVEASHVDGKLVEDLIHAAKNADWGQVVANGDPPCFHLEGSGRFCLRAARWPGHEGKNPIHLHEPLYVAMTRAVKAASTPNAPGRGADKDL